MKCACVDVYQLLNLKMHNETLKIGILYILFSNCLQYWSSLLYMSLQFVTGLFLLLSFSHIFFMGPGVA